MSTLGYRVVLDQWMDIEPLAIDTRWLQSDGFQGG